MHCALVSLLFLAYMLQPRRKLIGRHACIHADLSAEDEIPLHTCNGHDRGVTTNAESISYAKPSELAIKPCSNEKCLNCAKYKVMLRGDHCVKTHLARCTSDSNRPSHTVADKHNRRLLLLVQLSPDSVGILHVCCCKGMLTLFAGKPTKAVF